MQDYLSELGIKPFINAHDTITLYGGSRMQKNTLQAMHQIAGMFTDVMGVQRAVGARIAALTNNEAAYVTNGAAGALQLAAAVCMADGQAAAYKRLPDTHGMKDRFLVLYSQNHCYLKAIESAGGKIHLVGDTDEVLAFDLADAMTDTVAAVVYTPHIRYDPASLPLPDVIAMAHEKNIPVIVDAAAYLPPRENLWTFTQNGADMVIFSGGKTLRGPQASGMILGRKKWIEDCLRFGAPMHGICRSSKATKEAMIGLCVAVENYMNLNMEEEYERCSLLADRLMEAMKSGRIYRPWRVEHGSVGQSYPRVFARILPPATPEKVAESLLRRRICVGTSKPDNAIVISPLGLTEEEAATVCSALLEIDRSYHDIPPVQP